MIQLDTNYLIGLLAVPSPFQSQLLGWFNAGEKFAISSIAWSEFLGGPVTQHEIRDAVIILEERIIAFGIIEAEIAAKIYNQTGRRRGTRDDCWNAFGYA
jgi:predicted nucleic acid-binding protein